MNSLDKDPVSKYKDVLSTGYRNYQMYAFCPMTHLNDDICGTGRTDSDMKLSAKTSVGQVQTTRIKHNDQKQIEWSERANHVCHYEISAESSFTPTAESKLRISFSKMTNLDVRVYEGKSRTEATKPLI